MVTMVENIATETDVLKYHNESVVLRIKRETGSSYNEAVNIFNDTLRFLYLCGAYSGGFAPSPKIDDGWHAFILHTKDYQDFCLRYFNKFIHHFPNGEDFNKEKGLEQIKRTLNIAYSVFGELSSNWNYCATNNPSLVENEANCNSSCSDKPCNSCSGTSNCQS